MRKPRELKENALYHVVARANRQEFIFNSDKIKEMFLDVVKRAKKKYGFTVTNFCIMEAFSTITISDQAKSLIPSTLGIFENRFEENTLLKEPLWGITYMS